MFTLSLDSLLHRKYAPRGSGTVLRERSIRSLQNLIDNEATGKGLYELLSEVATEAEESGQQESQRELQSVVVDLIALNEKHLDSMRLGRVLKRYAKRADLTDVHVGPSGSRSWRTTRVEDMNEGQG